MPPEKAVSIAVEASKWPPDSHFFHLSNGDFEIFCKQAKLMTIPV